MLTLHFDPFPELTTQRLRLRAVDLRDKQEIFALRSDMDHMRYIAKPLMKDPDEAEQHIRSIQEGYKKQELINWAINFKESDKLIGVIGYYKMAKEHFRSEIGYMLHKNFHRRGIMHEALGAVVQFGFSKIGFHQVEAIIDKENIASERLLLKNRFVKEAHFKENYFFEEKFLDSVHYALLNHLA